MQQLILDIRPDTPPGFDNFLPGDNLEAMTAIREHAAGGLRESLIYLWGEPGIGKSHLLRAWARQTGAFTATPLPEPPLAYLAVDDVERLCGDDQIRLFNLINAAREGVGRLLVSAGAPPARLALRADLATRLAQGLVFRLHALSDADKAAAIRVRAEARGLRLPEELVRYLLTHSRRDLPHLLATVDVLDSQSLSSKRPLTLPLLKEVLARRTA